MSGAPMAAILVGCLIGFVLSLVGGGGSVLATPLLVYVVGLGSPHLAVGTSALSVGLTASLNLVLQARQARVNWPCAVLFSAAGVAGALLGSTLGKAYDGHRLLGAFGVLMCAMAVMTVCWRPPAAVPPPSEARNGRVERRVRLLGYGLCVGGLAGFFGIGGGMLSTPAIASASGMAVEAAVGSSLLAVAAFGFVTAGNYALSGMVDWQVAALFALGGPIGGWAGLALTRVLGPRRSNLRFVLAAILAGVGASLVLRG